YRPRTWPPVRSSAPVRAWSSAPRTRRDSWWPPSSCSPTTSCGSRPARGPAPTPSRRSTPRRSRTGSRRSSTAPCVDAPAAAQARRSEPMEHVLVTGAGGFIGGHLVRRLRDGGVGRIRAVDCKPKDEWYQVFDDVENVQADLQLLDACRDVTEGVDTVFNLAADMGGMGFIENNKALCMLSVLVSTH